MFHFTLLKKHSPRPPPTETQKLPAKINFQNKIKFTEVNVPLTHEEELLILPRSLLNEKAYLREEKVKEENRPHIVQ